MCTGPQVADPQLLAQIAVAVQLQVCLGQHLRMCLRLQPKCGIDRNGRPRDLADEQRQRLLRQQRETASTRQCLGWLQKLAMAEQQSTVLIVLHLMMQPRVRSLQIDKHLEGMLATDQVQQPHAGGGVETQRTGKIVTGNLQRTDRDAVDRHTGARQTCERGRHCRLAPQAIEHPLHLLASHVAGLACLDGSAQAIDPDQCRQALRIVFPELRQRLVIAGREIDMPQFGQHPLRRQAHFVALVEPERARIIRVEPAHDMQQIGVVLVAHTKTLHHQLGEGQRFGGRPHVRVAAERAVAGLGIVEAVPMEGVGMPVDAQGCEQPGGGVDGHLVHVGQVLGNVSSQGGQALAQGAVRVWGRHVKVQPFEGLASMRTLRRGHGYVCRRGSGRSETAGVDSFKPPPLPGPAP